MTGRRFTPTEDVRRAVVTESDVIGDGLCLIRYRFTWAAGGEGRSLVYRGEWDLPYWPPAVGDVVKVVERSVITLESRPRGEGR